MPSLRLLRHLVPATLCLGYGLAWAGPTAAPVRSEIDALLTTLQISGCQFSRNDSWYSGAQAKEHLLRKLDYIERSGTVHSTEQFIELAASKSSSSGAPYQVRCGNEPALASQRWLTRQLATLRSPGASAKP